MLVVDILQKSYICVACDGQRFRLYRLSGSPGELRRLGSTEKTFIIHLLARRRRRRWTVLSGSGGDGSTSQRVHFSEGPLLRPEVTRGLLLLLRRALWVRGSEIRASWIRAYEIRASVVICAAWILAL